MLTLEEPRAAGPRPSHIEEAQPELPTTDIYQTEEADDGKIPFSHLLAMSSAVFFPFVGVIGAMVLMWMYGFMGWLYLALMVVGWQIGGHGITVGFHRLFSHRAFETNRWVKAFWMFTGALSVQGSPLIWIAVHRKHHQYSDVHGDPHSPHTHGEGFWNALAGFAHSHVGWLFTSHWTKTSLKKYVPDLITDPLLVAVDRLYFVWVLLSLVAPAIIAGLVTMSWTGAALGFIWGGLVRTFLTHHITFSINSVCHVFGRRPYESGDHSRNNAMCGVLGHGEGWHNNHHAFPTSARLGLKWWQLDTGWMIIRAMQFVGLAWNVRLPSERALAAKQLA